MAANRKQYERWERHCWEVGHKKASDHAAPEGQGIRYNLSPAGTIISCNGCNWEYRDEEALAQLSDT